MRPARPPVLRLAVLALFLALVAVESRSSSQGKRPLAVDNLYDVRDVRDPQRSPDGKWVAYTVTRAIRETDKNDTDVWMVSWDGREHVQLTSTPDNESRPRLEPGRKISVVSLLPARCESGASLAPQSRRRGSRKAHRHQGRHHRLRMVAGQPFARAHRSAA